jgi:exosortase H (IPTLxxWG-CTERM-specific)
MSKKNKTSGSKKQGGDASVSFGNLLRSPLIRFLGVFSLLMIVFYLFWWMDFFKEYIVYPWNGLNASISSLILRMFGQGTHAEGMIIIGRNVSISIKEGCDAIEPAMLFISAVVAFPAAWKKKLKGIAFGVVILFGINLFRIISLFLVQKFWPAAFDFMHIQFWQVVFILLAVVLWVQWMRTTSPPLSHVES